MWRWLAGQIPWFLCHRFAALHQVEDLCCQLGVRDTIIDLCRSVVTLSWCRKSLRSRHEGYPCRRSLEVHIVASWPRVPGRWWRPFERSRCFRRPGDTGISGDRWCDHGFYITIVWASVPSGKMEFPNKSHSCSCMDAALCVQHEKDKRRSSGWWFDLRLTPGCQTPVDPVCSRGPVCHRTGCSQTRPLCSQE